MKINPNFDANINIPNSINSLDTDLAQTYQHKIPPILNQLQALKPQKITTPALITLTILSCLIIRYIIWLLISLLAS